MFVDSSVWIDHLRGLPTPEIRLLHDLLHDLAPSSTVIDPVQIVIGDVVLLEVLRGIDDERQQQLARRTLTSFDLIEVGGTSVALAAVDHYRALRRQGITVRKAIDCLIAAWCIGNSVPLLHADRDFLPFVEHCGLLSADTANVRATP
ncbi:type II toxin-antitoxin system VapC family toxin [Marinimicrococcus flavescens]|uniref:Ribonuclease VapC n=1 Tax=Marinimicrococcus flavescens TaxID=3031815 RepID=A0AAP4D5F6_9PROT|nr:PIN domain-containing protein [Marinimicrococcus flavescens]